MTRRGKHRQSLPLIAAMLGATPATAEILFVEGGGVASVDTVYAYAHPALRSVVFVSPETRQMAILPPPPVFVQPPPLIWRASSAFPAYPPANPVVAPNAPARPSNRDVTTYNLQRAHGFSQELFYRGTYLNVGATAPLYFPWYGSAMPAYPPTVGNGGFNQPARPSNRDNTTYNLERAHRFSMDAYKKP